MTSAAGSGLVVMEVVAGDEDRAVFGSGVEVVVAAVVVVGVAVGVVGEGVVVVGFVVGDSGWVLTDWAEF